MRCETGFQGPRTSGPPRNNAGGPSAAPAGRGLGLGLGGEGLQGGCRAFGGLSPGNLLGCSRRRSTCPAQAWPQPGGPLGRTLVPPRCSRGGAGAPDGSLVAEGARLGRLRAPPGDSYSGSVSSGTLC